MPWGKWQKEITVSKFCRGGVSPFVSTRVAVLASGGGTNLQALIDAQHRGALGGGIIAGVIASNPEAYALTRAAHAGIPAAVVSRKDYDSRERFTEAIIQELHGFRADLVVLAGFNFILSPVFAETYRHRVLNVHPALIPAFCGKGFYGMKVHEAVLASGVKLTGATVHIADEVCDGGPIILQKAIPVLPDDTPETLQRRVMEQCEWDLLPKATALFCAGKIRIVENRTVIT